MSGAAGRDAHRRGLHPNAAPSPETAAPTLPTRPSRWQVRIGIVTLAVALGWAALTLEVKWSQLPGAPGDLYHLGTLMFGRMEAGLIGGRLSALWESVAMAWVGTVLAAIVAVPMSFLAAGNLAGTALSWVIRQVFNILRAVPEIIIAIALVPIFGLSLQAGMLALAIGSVGTLGKLCYEVLEGIDDGPIEAAAAVGGTRLQRLRWGVIPQSAPELASFALYRFEVNVRASAVLGLVDAGGIGQDIYFALENQLWGRAGVGLIVVILGTIAIDVISGRVRRRLIAGPRQRIQASVDVESTAASMPSA